MTMSVDAPLSRSAIFLVMSAGETEEDLAGVRDALGTIGAELPDAALIGEDADPDFAGGSYVVVQKHLHDMSGWAALSTEEQEAIMGPEAPVADDTPPATGSLGIGSLRDGP